MYKKNRVQKISLPTHLQKKIGWKKIHNSSFLSKNREGKIKWEEVNIPPLNTLLLHMVTKLIGECPPE